MHRRPSALTALRPLAAAGLLLVVAGCSSAVKATPFADSDSAVCREVAAAWPATVGGQTPREVAVQSEGVAAWGDPAIIARCGATSPGPTTDPCIDADGVDWVAHELEDGYAFTTFGREPGIEVLVPSAYAPEPLLLSAFRAAAEVVPPTGPHCT
ncbi:DUF3515 family protein [Ornithinicoccus hortensis]|uniref:Uncharacterized protein DUF3515 n=1 Tax=Ornithinicoccus hortensis TaxID=82346 RepID=A0A542YRJ2_9MICO|nr:DUF3515 family protein [Ornithinicoccus hortensis]TQL50719.1 uncharacterized protein DUF3515 [Ornithinicoccus hortensis]